MMQRDFYVHFVSCRLAYKQNNCQMLLQTGHKEASASIQSLVAVYS